MTDLRNLHDEMMRCVEEGLSLRQTALRLGLTLRVITKVSEWYGFSFAANKNRNDEIVSLFLAGKNYVQIGDQFGITRERVRQIIVKRGISPEQGGVKAILAVRRAQKANAKEIKRKRFIEEKGLSHDAYIALVRNGVTRVFIKTKRNAKSLMKAEWRLRLGEFWAIWEASGKWSERGVGSGYQFVRIDRSLPYEVGNVHVISGVDRSAEILRRTRSRVIQVEAAQ